MIYLVRHGSAGNPQMWEQPDDLRPLDDQGRQQAARLAALLADRPITRVLSSPSLRCTQTVGPLARHLVIEVETAAELLEGRVADRVVDYLATLDGVVVACSHGDVIPEVLRHLSGHGTELPEPRRSAKGSVWELERDGDRVLSGRYWPPG
ncbi:hypothetical protein BH24ACT3_BH24ACT3_14300 [soil metagenome]